MTLFLKIPRNNISIRKLLQEEDFAILPLIPFNSSTLRMSLSSRYVESRLEDSKLKTIMKKKH